MPILIKKAEMANQSAIPKTLLEIFGFDDGIEIKWAHAVNSRKKLSDCLKDDNIQMLEADIILGENNVPIMAHPPNNLSDITLSHWLADVFSYGKKGIKLDFKQTEAISPSLSILKPIMELANNIPVILNADILSGPNNNQSKPVDARVFFKKCKHFSNAILSPGWTTSFIGSSSEGYSWAHVNQMFELVKDTNLHVTFPVRASLVRQSKEQLLWLIEQNKALFTLTIWTSTTDNFDVKELAFLRHYKKLVYFDMPDDEINLLKAIL